MALPSPSNHPAWLSAEMNYDREMHALTHNRFSQIHKARETRTQNLLVIKIYDDLALDKHNSQRRNFIRHEAAMLMAVRHGPNIVFAGPARHLDDLNQSVEIPMDFYHYNLTFLLKKTERQRGIKNDGRGVYVMVAPFYYTLLSQMLKALEFLHTEVNIVHRQVTPANILCNNMDHFVLADFGIAGKLVAPISHDVATTNHYYMAPESYNITQYETAVDIWGLGVVCGVTLFAGSEDPLGLPDQKFDEAIWRNFTSRIRSAAQSVKKPEIQMMLQNLPSERPTAKDLSAFVKKNIDPRQKHFQHSEGLRSTSPHSEAERQGRARDPVQLAPTSAGIMQKEKDADLPQATRSTTKKSLRSTSVPPSTGLQRSPRLAISSAKPTPTGSIETNGPSSSAAPSTLKDLGETAGSARSATTSKAKNPEEISRRLGPVTEPSRQQLEETAQKPSPVAEPSQEQLGETAQKPSSVAEPSSHQEKKQQLSKYQKQKLKKQRRKQPKPTSTTASLPLVPQKATEPAPQTEADAPQTTRTPQAPVASYTAKREQGLSPLKAPVVRAGQNVPPSKTAVGTAEQRASSSKTPIITTEQSGLSSRTLIVKAEQGEPLPKTTDVKSEQRESPPKASDTRVGPKEANPKLPIVETKQKTPPKEPVIRTEQRKSPPKAPDVISGHRGSPPKASDLMPGQRGSAAETEVSTSHFGKKAPEGSPQETGAQVSPQRVEDRAPQTISSLQAITAQQGISSSQGTGSSQNVRSAQAPTVPQAAGFPYPGGYVQRFSLSPHFRPPQAPTVPQAAGFSHPGGYAPSMRHAPPVEHLQSTQYPPSAYYPPSIGSNPPAHGQPMTYTGATVFPSSGGVAVGYPQSVGRPTAAASSQAATIPQPTGSRRAPGEAQRGRPQKAEGTAGLAIKAAQSPSPAQRQSRTVKRAPNTINHGASTDSPPRLSSPWAQTSGATTVQSRPRSSGPTQRQSRPAKRAPDTTDHGASTESPTRLASLSPATQRAIAVQPPPQPAPGGAQLRGPLP